jgi:hypothetical protein
MLDPQMRQGPANLRWRLAIDFTASRGREEVVSATVSIETQRQAMRAEYLQQGLKCRISAFLGQQEGRVDRVRCVIHRHHQV